MVKMVIALAILVSLLVSAAGADDFNTTRKEIIILAGQSNMSGRGSLLYDVLPECEGNEKILRFAANGSWEYARDPLHIDIDVAKANLCGVGPGMPFSNALLKMKPDFGVIGLVPCAVGDTSISQWQQGQPLYNAMISRALAAAELNGGGVIRGMLWYQGEADIGDGSGVSARLYKLRFQQFIKDVRQDLKLPSLPIVEVALNYLYLTPIIEQVRKSQLETAEELPFVKCVDARGLLLVPYPDNIHLTTTGQVHLAGEMANAFLQLIS